jgi:hypothetical protein
MRGPSSSVSILLVCVAILILVHNIHRETNSFFDLCYNTHKTVPIVLQRLFLYRSCESSTLYFQIWNGLDPTRAESTRDFRQVVVPWGDFPYIFSCAPPKKFLLCVCVLCVCVCVCVFVTKVGELCV